MDWQVTGEGDDIEYILELGTGKGALNIRLVPNHQGGHGWGVHHQGALLTTYGAIADSLKYANNFAASLG